MLDIIKVTDKEEKALLNKANELIVNNQYDDAIRLNNKILETNPNNPYAKTNLAICFYETNQPERIVELAKVILRSNFENTPVSIINDFANHLDKIDELKLALKFKQKSIEKDPDNFAFLYSAGVICLKSSNFTKALEYFKQAEKIKQTSSLYKDMAMALLHLYTPIEAKENLQKALKLNENDDKIYSSFASVYQALGEKEKVVESLEKALSLNNTNCYSYYLLSKTKKFKNDNERSVFVESIIPLLNKPELKRDDKLFLCFSLGKVYGELKDYEKSFFYYKIANEKKNENCDYNINIFISGVERYKASFTKDVLKSKKTYGSPSNLPIFILGMPRSGTTLTEQIISCHSKVYGAGELNYLDLIASEIKDKTIKGNFSTTPFPENIAYMTKNEVKKIAGEYLGLITKEIGKCQKVTNKMPANFQHVGFIQLLFPNAKIIHCKRHPMDIFLSIYFQHFKYVEYSSNPSLIVGYYKTYHKIMQHWQEQLPGKIYNSYYEELITHQEAKSKGLIDYCGLKWEEQCLSFHQNKREIHTASHVQVRQKLYSDSMLKWKKYEKYLVPVKEALKDEINEYESELEQRIGKIN